MKIILQRVSRASVTVDDKITGSIDRGFVVLLGVGSGDNKAKAEKLVEKIKKLRIFPDDQGKTNLSIDEINGSLLIISQFTLYADCRKGNRPSFTDAASPDIAEEIYNYFINYAQGKFNKIERGTFGAHMKVELINDGPFTVILED